MLSCYHISRNSSYAHLRWNYVNSFGTSVFISLQHIIRWNNSYRLRVCNARWIQFNAWRAVIISTFYFTLVSKLVAVANGWRISLIQCEPMICEGVLKASIFCTRHLSYEMLSKLSIRSFRVFHNPPAHNNASKIEHMHVHSIVHSLVPTHFNHNFVLLLAVSCAHRMTNIVIFAVNKTRFSIYHATEKSFHPPAARTAVPTESCVSQFYLKKKKTKTNRISGLRAIATNTFESCTDSFLFRKSRKCFFFWIFQLNDDPVFVYSLICLSPSKDHIHIVRGMEFCT